MASRSLPLILVRLESLAILLATLILYREVGASWWLFALLFLVPDLSLLPYVRGVGTAAAAIYNGVHTYAIPVLLFIVGLMVESSSVTAVALIWAAHIAFDRLLGFGFKYPEAFKDTHLQRI